MSVYGLFPTPLPRGKGRCQVIQAQLFDIIKRHEDTLSKINPPGIDPPTKTIDIFEGHKKSIVRHLFGVNYFNKSLGNNILKKICTNDMAVILFNTSHILKQSKITTTREEIKQTKAKAISEIESGESAKEWVFEDDLYKQYEREQKEKLKALENGEESVK